MAISTPSPPSLPTGNEPELESFSLFDNSITFTFLEPPPSLNASVLIRTTYHSAHHPLIQRGKNHPQVPPYHLHFSQTESFTVLQGRVGTTTGYDVKDSIWTRANTFDAGQIGQIRPWVPHTFWPVPRDYQPRDKGVGEREALQEGEEEEDAVLLLWAHPRIKGGIGEGGADGGGGYGGDMDYVFFRSLLLMTSDMGEGKVKERAGLSALGALGAVMALQMASDSTLVVAPESEWLGLLRWWVPFTAQKTATWLWKLLGGRPDGLVEAYVPRANWERLEQKKEQ